MSFKESSMQSLFSRWVKANKERFDKSSAFELKLSKTDKIYYSQVRQHQYYYLEETTGCGTYHKISDMSVNLKPYDCFLIKGDAYVVVMFYKPKKPKIAYLIPIKTWNLQRRNSPKKHIKEHECKTIAHMEIEL